MLGEHLPLCNGVTVTRQILTTEGHVKKTRAYLTSSSYVRWQVLRYQDGLSMSLASVGRTVYKDRTMVWILILSQDMTNF